MKHINRTLCAYLLFLMIGTALAGGGISQKILLGKWSGSGTNSRGDVLTTSFELKADATFEGTAEMNHKPFWSYSGTWSLTGNQLVWTYTKSSVPLPESIRVDTDEIVLVDKNHLTLLSKLSGERRDISRIR